MNLKDLELVNALDQNFYDSFNTFMISSDLKVFGKLLARTQLFESVKDIPGDIVECGVFRGTGLFTFLRLFFFERKSSHKFLHPSICLLYHYDILLERALF